ncbi:hypothetical protein KJS94_12360 [Flavihumibacter rivuli]|uniref:hypothetical protein n=1 Tax=Flavihumibacter rivuli TaxID=2838156 RepID=UPI001BDEA9CF|nr:hypothetical protein [Flavihumibacter rivuli]ULQ55435.1 hypothetical protein KJS94_12360 [Flavihumibacter rivuli]
MISRTLIKGFLLWPLCFFVAGQMANAQDAAGSHPKLPPVPSSFPDWLNRVIADSLNHKYANGRGDLDIDAVALSLENWRNIPALGSLSNTTLKNFGNYVNGHFGKKGLDKINRLAGIDTGSWQPQSYITDKIKGFYALQNPFPVTRESLRHPVSLKMEKASYSFHNNAANLGQSNFQHVDLKGGLTAFGIPFQSAYSNLSEYQRPFDLNSMLQLKFNKTALTNMFKDQLLTNYKLDKLLLNDLDISAYARKFYQASLQLQWERFSGEGIAELRSVLERDISFEELLYLDRVQLMNRILPDSRIRQIQDELNAARLQLDNGSLIAETRDSLSLLILSKERYLRNADSLLMALDSTKKGLLQQGFSIDRLTKSKDELAGQVNAELNNPAFLNDAARNHLPVTGLQKFFSLLQQFNLGSFGSSATGSNLVNQFFNGIELSGIKKRTVFAGGLGNVKEFGFFKDAGLQSALALPAGFSQFLSLGKRSGNEGNATNLTISNGNTNPVDRNGFQMPGLQRNIFTGGLSRQFSLGEQFRVSASFAKSSTQFRNEFSTQTGGLDAYKPALAEFFNDFWSQVSAELSYSGSSRQINMEHGAHVKYSGIGFNNATSVNVTRGTINYGGFIRKQWAKNKINFRLRFDNRAVNRTPDGGAKWLNYQHDAELGLKLKKANRIQVRYGSFQTYSSGDSLGKSLLYGTVRFGVQAVNRWKAFGRSISSNLSVNYQSIRSGTTGSRMVNLQLMESMPLKRNVLSLVLLYNKEIAENRLVGDLFSGDLAISYALSKRISASSSVTYLDNQLFARQIGIKQSINANIAQRFSLSAYVDARHDLIPVAMPLLYAASRAELTIHYHLK